MDSVGRALASRWRTFTRSAARGRLPVRRAFGASISAAAKRGFSPTSDARGRIVAVARRGISGRRQPRLDPRLRRALAGIAVGDRRFPAGWRNAEAVEQHRQLIRDPVFGVVAAALVYRADDVPLVVRAAAERRRRFERVVIAKRGLREAVLRRLLERRIRLDSLVEELVDLRHV